MRLRAIVTAAVLAALTGLTACGTTATSGIATVASSTATDATSSAASPASTVPVPVETTPTETTATMGDTLTVTIDGSEAGEITASSPTATQRAIGEFGERPARGYYITIVITAKAATAITEPFSVNPFDFYVRTTDGTHIEYGDGNAITAQRDDQLDAVDLNAGETVKGTLTLDVPAPHGTLVYAPFSQAVGSWSF